MKENLGQSPGCRTLPGRPAPQPTSSPCLREPDSSNNNPVCRFLMGFISPQCAPSEGQPRARCRGGKPRASWRLASREHTTLSRFRQTCGAGGRQATLVLHSPRARGSEPQEWRILTHG